MKPCLDLMKSHKFEEPNP
uniref:Uncharacterized protein n=1 Tax=Arundo donax TaxID=35708 RepID=A0A0A8YIW1_ARUDO